MTGRFIILLILLMTSGMCFSQNNTNMQQPRSAVVSVSLKPNSSITFNIYDIHLQSFKFKNISNTPQVITQKIILDKPSLIVYNSMLMIPDSPVYRTYPILLIPGDSVLLNEGIDKAISVGIGTGYQNFIDSLIAFIKDSSGHILEEQQNTLLKTKGISKAVQFIQTTFDKNEVLIRDLQMPQLRRNWLRKLNENIKYSAIAHLLADPTVNRSALTDSLYDNIYQHLDDTRSINTTNNLGIYGAIIYYNAKKQKPDIDKKDLWACIAGADRQLKHTNFYSEYLTSIIVRGFINTPKETRKINEELSKIRTDAPVLDSLFQLTSILNETFSNFSLARQKLKLFANGRYSFIIENDEQTANHETKTIKNLPVVTMYDFKGKSSDFKNIVMNKKYKFTLIDFWASWCIPCIAEIPKLKKVENEMKGKPIQFVTISIDEDNETDKWIKAAKSNGIFTEPLQYRIANFKQSSLTRLINLRTIPRYLIIDNKGNILDEDFYRPSDPQFQLELMKYIN